MSKYFYGHYFKLQSKTQTISLIPSYAKVGKEYKASLQIITNNGSFVIDYPYSEYKRLKGFEVSVGNNEFTSNGIKLDVDCDTVKAKGEIKFGEFTKLKGSIMGIFRIIPFLECIHQVVSIRHKISGSITIDGEVFDFNKDSYGYIEGDRGRSFPSCYIWTQALSYNRSIMLSVANIPFGLFSFTGIIGFIHTNGETIKIGTYRFAKAIKIKDNEVIVKQGKYRLVITLIDRNEFPLQAPISGKMDRIIKESAECVVRYKLYKKDELLFDELINNASFEYEYTKENEFDKLEKK